MIDKDLLKNSLSIDQIFQIVSNFGGNPTYAKNGLIADTICHNSPGQGSHKLYYYEDSKTFHCYTGDCGNFDIYELVKRVFKIQKNQDLEFSACLYFVANFFNINDFTFTFDSSENVAPRNELIDFLDRVEQWRPTEKVILKEYDGTILKNLPCYRIKDWEKEGIKYGTLKKYEIRFYSPSKKIVIPHRDINGRLIGIRGRALSDFDIENFGKYMPLYLTNGQSFAHPLGYNLYGLYKTKKNIGKMKKAIIFEGEKSVMKLDSYVKNNFSVAACGSKCEAREEKHEVQFSHGSLGFRFVRGFFVMGLFRGLRSGCRRLRVDRVRNFGRRGGSRRSMRPGMRNGRPGRGFCPRPEPRRVRRRRYLRRRLCPRFGP